MWRKKKQRGIPTASCTRTYNNAAHLFYIAVSTQSDGGSRLPTMAKWWVVCYMRNGNKWIKEIKGDRRSQRWMRTMLKEGHTCVRWRPWHYLLLEKDLLFQDKYWSEGGPYFHAPAGPPWPRVIGDFDLELHQTVQILENSLEVANQLIGMPTSGEFFRSGINLQWVYDVMHQLHAAGV
jgi:hypothetical protein